MKTMVKRIILFFLYITLKNVIIIYQKPTLIKNKTFL